ncbi:MAG: hypothetical protein P1U34_11125 [Coxiellaceae bacterium]|nr:hypothetical protein [Coxiellaceae bacterium]
MKIVKQLSIALLIIATPIAIADNVTLTITNHTNTDFTAKTRFGQYLGRITRNNPVVISAPFLPFPKYAVSLVGDNGFNAAIINTGNGPYCSTQFGYHNCQFTQVSFNSARLIING